jgi:hypothetical protein
MDLYILVHHRLDPNQPWQNDWLDKNVPNSSLLDYILTTQTLAQACNVERIKGNRVFIHRCKYKSSPRVICTSALVSAVCLSQNKVSFSNHQTLNLVPPIKANRCNEIFYAFYCDSFARINDQKPKTSLKPAQRIKLAIKSYASLTLNFGFIHFLLPDYFLFNYPIDISKN